MSLQFVLPYFIMRVISGTTSATIGTQTTHAHGDNRVPFYYVIKPKSNGVVYESAVPTSTNIYVKGSAASLTFDAFCFFTV